MKAAVVVLLLLASAGFAASVHSANWSGPYKSCSNRAELTKTGHMELGVRIDTSNPGVAIAFKRAFDFWSKVLDASFHPSKGSECALAIVDGTPELLQSQIVARSQFSDLADFQAWIAFDPHASSYMTAEELYATAVHELGHLFGLRHNPHAISIMYYLDCDTTGKLDMADLEALGRRHMLRAGLSREVPVRP